MTTQKASVTDDLAAVTRKRFVRMIIEHGTRRPTPKVMGPAEALTDDGDCWSAACRHAQMLQKAGQEARYVEGSCRIPAGPDPITGEDRPHRVVRAHAWVEIDHPILGATIVEVTRGYETADLYRGIPVDSTPGGDVDRASATWDADCRSSVIEAALAGDPNSTYAQVLAQIAPPQASR